jgi:uncharacterized protein (TIGR02284 family)
MVACRDEVIPLDSAALSLEGSERKRRLRRQSQRRTVFLRDLGTAVIALGGVPANQASTRARLLSELRSVRAVLAGYHLGDAYAACARATEKTEEAYWTALQSELPADVRFGLERQYAEIEVDRDELRRLRWGASPTPMADDLAKQLEDKSVPAKTLPSEDVRALDTWGDEGGQYA